MAKTAVDGIPAGHPDRPQYLSNLGESLLARFQQTGELTDLDAAVRAGQAAVESAPRRPLRGTCLCGLQNALDARFERTGAIADLDAAVQADRAAVAGTPARPP